MPRRLQHINRVLILVVGLLTTWGSNALYASSPIEFCIDRQGHVHIIFTAENVSGTSFALGTHFSQGFGSVAAISITEHNNSAGAASDQIVSSEQFNSINELTISNAAYRQRMAYLFFADLPPPSVICS